MVSLEKTSKMAELNDIARLLQALFEVENRKAVERIKKVKEEVKVSQDKGTTIRQECEEIKKRTHSLREDMRCLEKKTVERKSWKVSKENCKGEKKN